MRILLATTEFPPYSGGIATFAEAFANGAAAVERNIIVLAPDYDAPLADDTNIVRDRGMLKSSVDAQRALVREIGNQNPNALLLANGKATLAAARIGSLPVPTAIYLHGSEVVSFFVDRKLSPSDETAVRNLYVNSALFANSGSTANLINEAFPEVADRVTVAHLGIDLGRIDVPETAPQRERPMILCVSRLYPDKGHDVLINAMPAVLKELPTADLRFAGDGPCRADLEQRVKMAGLESQITFVGDLAPNQLSEQYADCDLFAMISRRESFGLVFLEANLFGKPVVAGRTGGVPEAVVDGETGILVDPNSVEETANAIIELLSNPAKREAMGTAGRERVLREFTHVHMAERILRVLDDLPKPQVDVRRWARRELRRLRTRQVARGVLRRMGIGKSRTPAMAMEET